MNLKELKALLEKLCLLPSETEWVEFKEAKNNIQFDDLGKYFSALSNEANLKELNFGWLVLGISDQPPRKIVGTNYRPNRPALDRLKKEIADFTTNRLSFDEIHELHLSEGRVLMFQIPPAIRGVPTPWKGHYYGREGESLAPLSLSKMEQIRGQVLREDWSAQICKGATINDLDQKAILKAREEYKVKYPQKIEEAEKWNDIQFLNKSKLTIHGRITNASIILLGKPESAALLSPAVARISWFLKDENKREKDYEHFDPPFLLNVDRVFSKVRNLKYRHMPSGTLFPLETTQYDHWVIREALHNCIAHQDYHLHGRINLVETPLMLILTNVGSFLPGSVETVIQQDAPPEVYRNLFLSTAMVNLNMIDTQGGGIRKMFETQMRRYFPLPDYDLSQPDRVVVRIQGEILDERYTRLLIERTDLDLWTVILLDKVQRGLRISREGNKALKKLKLVEGRYPNLFISSRLASATGEEVLHIRYKGFENKYYKDLIEALIREHGPVTREKINSLLMDKLPEVLTKKQKKTKIHNLLYELSTRKGKIENQGSRKHPQWTIKGNNKQ
jgi:ATP-dependent DNA helicase RecG